MCGICGFVLDRDPGFDCEAILREMTSVMEHRGPDDEGYFVDPPAYLGHRRLEIIDLEGGKQPMTNEDGSVVVVFNGEIYNFTRIREDLEKKGHTFRTRSDTEVLVHLWEEEGPDMPARLNGMFAFAVLDLASRRLFLARDRMGQKPLYYASLPGGFVFASELTSLMKNPLVGKPVDPAALRMYLLYDTVPAPRTILEGVSKLEPGCSIEVDAGRTARRRYWDLSFPPEGEEPPPFGEACERFRSLLTESTRLRLMSDVPLGVLLSGGIDSSSLVAVLSGAIDPSAIDTFCVRFEQASFDESQYARHVASKFGTHHAEKTLDSQTMMDLLPRIISGLDEPLADNSLVPTYLLCGFVREHVTVALGGDGGDELALGYPTFQAHKLARVWSLVPHLFRRATARMARALPVSTENISLDFRIKRFLKGMEYDRFSRHFIWIGGLAPDEQQSILAPDLCRASPMDTLEPVRRHLARCTPRDEFDALTYLYCKLYMCDDILAKVDRASMMHSLEVRSPFLDPPLVEFLVSLPTSYKIRHLDMKHVVKSAMSDLLDREILYRKKKGFGFPVAAWFKGPLRDWVGGLLEESNLARWGFFDPAGVGSLWQEHLSGRRDNRKILWSLVVFLLWLDRNLG